MRLIIKPYVILRERNHTGRARSLVYLGFRETGNVWLIRIWDIFRDGTGLLFNTFNSKTF